MEGGPPEVTPQPEGSLLARPHRRHAALLHRPVAFVQRYDLSLLAAFTTLLYVISYLNFPATPDARWMGWFGWFDQGEYLKTARDLAALKVTYRVYPLGYPLIGALFMWILPVHQFFLPNLLFTVGITLLFYSIALTLITKLEALALTVVGVFAPKLLWEWTLIVPWNSIPVIFVSFLCVYLIVFRKPSLRSMGVCSVAIGCAFFCRPWDALFLGILYAAGLYMLATWKERIKAAAFLVSSLLLVTLAVAAAYLVVFGTIFSPYMKRLS